MCRTGSCAGCQELSLWERVAFTLAGASWGAVVPLAPFLPGQMRLLYRPESD